MKFFISGCFLVFLFLFFCVFLLVYRGDVCSSKSFLDGVFFFFFASAGSASDCVFHMVEDENVAKEKRFEILIKFTLREE